MKNLEEQQKVYKINSINICQIFNKIVYGLDLTTDIEEIRKYTGLCCQKDVLYDDLTVEEHLKLIASIKGVPPNLMQQEIDFVMAKCGLTADRAKRTKIMNGGGKRKLSLGMALIGGSKLVFLDEPTSGKNKIIIIIIS